MDLQQPNDGSVPDEASDIMPASFTEPLDVQPKLNATKAVRTLLSMQNQITGLKNTISELQQQKLGTIAEVQRLNYILVPLQQDAIENTQRISGLELAIGDLKAQMALIDIQLKDLAAQLTALELKYLDKFAVTKTRFEQ